MRSLGDDRAHGVRFITNDRGPRRDGARLPLARHRRDLSRQAGRRARVRGNRARTSRASASATIPTSSTSSRRAAVSICSSAATRMAARSAFRSSARSSCRRCTKASYAQDFTACGGVLMYVSRGIGAIPPLRILCRPEVATFVLSAAAEAMITRVSEVWPAVRARRARRGSRCASARAISTTSTRALRRMARRAGITRRCVTSRRTRRSRGSGGAISVGEVGRS